MPFLKNFPVLIGLAILPISYSHASPALCHIFYKGSESTFHTLRGQSFGIIKDGLKSYAIDKATGQRLDDISVVHFTKRFLKGRVDIIEKKPTDGDLKSYTRGGDTFIIKDSKHGVRAFDSNGLELELPPKIKFLSPKDIVEVLPVGSNLTLDIVGGSNGLALIRLKSGTAYTLEILEKDVLNHQPDFKFTQLQEVKISAEGSSSEYFNVDNGRINVRRLEQNEMGILRLRQVPEQEANSQISAADSLPKSGLVVPIERGGKKLLATVSTNGLVVINPVSHTTYKKYLATDAAVEVNLAISDIAQVGDRLVLVTDKGFIRSFSMEDVFSTKSPFIQFEKTAFALPHEPGILSNLGETTRIESTGDNQFRVIKVSTDKYGKTNWVVIYFKVGEDGQISEISAP